MGQQVVMHAWPTRQMQRAVHKRPEREHGVHKNRGNTLSSAKLQEVGEPAVIGRQRTVASVERDSDTRKDPYATSTLALLPKARKVSQVPKAREMDCEEEAMRLALDAKLVRALVRVGMMSSQEDHSSHVSLL